MDTDMERMKRALAPDLHARAEASGVDWLVNLAAEMMATLTGAELDALARGELHPSEHALAALAEREHADEDAAADPESDVIAEAPAGDCRIARFFHCAQCGKAGEPSWLSVGAWADGVHVEVWCERHAASLIVARLAAPLFAALPACEAREHGDAERQQ